MKNSDQPHDRKRLTNSLPSPFWITNSDGWREAPIGKAIGHYIDQPTKGVEMDINRMVEMTIVEMTNKHIKLLPQELERLQQDKILQCHNKTTSVCQRLWF